MDEVVTGVIILVAGFALGEAFPIEKKLPPPLPVFSIAACDAHEITNVKNICICVPSDSEQDYIVR